MIEQLLECIKLDLKTDSETIAIAKGKYKLPKKKNNVLNKLKNSFKKYI